MNDEAEESEQVTTVVVGGGQAGLSVGYHLALRGLPFVILDANQRIGDAWRNRWDSLRVFTPARYDGLAGMPFPAPARSFPTKDEVADYLEAYAARFDLPVQTGVRVDRLSKIDGRFVLTAGDRRFEAETVVVAMSSYRSPRVPPYATELNPDVIQMHSNEYRNPSQLRDGNTLVVGAHDSGCEIALDIASGHRTWLSGRDTGHVPFRVDGLVGRFFGVPFVMFMFHRVLAVNTPIGRKMRPRILQILQHAGPVVRVKPKDIAADGVERVPRVVGVRGGLPVLEDERVLEVANVIWCTGFHHDFPWIDLPIFGEEGPMHDRGVASEPGLYFVGLWFLYAGSSALLRGAGRDAERVVKAIGSRIT